MPIRRIWNLARNRESSELIITVLGKKQKLMIELTVYA